MAQNTENIIWTYVKTVSDHYFSHNNCSVFTAFCVEIKTSVDVHMYKKQNNQEAEIK